MEKIWVECGRGDCPESSQVAFDTDAGNARFQLEKGWTCLPVVGVVNPKGEGDQFWFVCPKHRNMAVAYLRTAQRSATVDAILQWVNRSADDVILGRAP